MHFKQGQLLVFSPDVGPENGFYKGYVHKILDVHTDGSLSTVIVRTLYPNCAEYAVGLQFTLKPYFNTSTYNSASLYKPHIFTKANKCL